MMLHPTRDSIDYAVALAEYAHPDAATRIRRIIDNISALQDRSERSSTFGTWPWYVEEPLAQMRPPDLNWACFIGARLAELLWDHCGLMSPETIDKAQTALATASASIVRRNVPLDYTNVVVMSIRVTAMAGHLLKRPDLIDYAATLVSKFRRHTESVGSFAEYNSPTYTFLVILELGALLHFIKDDQILKDARPVWRLAWDVTAHHFHSSTNQWAGPHSRAYSDLLTPQEWAQIETHLGLDVPDSQLPPLPPRRIMIGCPGDLKIYFAEAAPVPRVERNRFQRFDDTGEEVWGTTWLDKEVCLGSASIGTFWSQARPVIGYWRGTPRPVIFRARMLKDGKDFASFGIRSVQEDGRVLLAAYPITKGGDTHLFLDHKPEGYEGRKLVLRLSVQGRGARANRITNNRYELTCESWKAIVTTGNCTYDGSDMSDHWTASALSDVASADLEINLDGRIIPQLLGETIFTAAVAIVPLQEVIEPPPVQVSDSETANLPGTKAVSWGKLHLSSPSLPAVR